ncbi:hypothetical protein JAAARDRAFT_165374, partial [Jaapia argillacea MUCL 33604]
MPSPSHTPDAKSSGLQLVRDSEYLIQSFLPGEAAPPSYSPTELPLPLCIPQIKGSFDSPFLRGYNAALGDTVDLTETELLSFIDGLNLAIVASPPLRVVSVAAMGISFVPYHWAIIAGVAVQTAVQTGIHVLSKTLTDRYLRAANLRLFKPRGLSARLCTTEAMLHLIAGAPVKEESSTMKTINKVGRGVGSLLLRLPIPFSSRIVRAISDKPPTVEVTQGDAKNSIIRRRLALVDGIALPLDLNVPPPEKAQGVMDTMQSWGVKFEGCMSGRQEKKAEEKRRALADRQSAGGSRRQRRAHGPVHTLIGARETRGERKVKNADLIEHWGTKKTVGKESRCERKAKNADLVEHWGTKTTLWLVILPAEKDEEIEGIEMAEDPENEERVDDRTFQEELELE